MKVYSIKLNKKQFRTLHKAWSEAETILLGSTDLFFNVKKYGLAISALKSKDRLLRRLWKLMWFSENYDLTIKLLESLRQKEYSEFITYYPDFGDFTNESTEDEYVFNVFIDDKNIERGKREVKIRFELYEMMLVKSLYIEVEKHEVTI